MLKAHSAVFAVMLGLVIGLIGVQESFAQDDALPGGEEVVANVNARDDGEFLTRDMKITMTDKSGKTRVQHTHTYRRYFGEEKRAVIFYTDPANVKDTGFLTYDYPDPEKDDDQWLYLPALRRVRRISSSNRGDYYLGTDLTYEDIKQDTRISATDYNWKTIGSEEVEGENCLLIEGTPVSPEIAEELGISKYRAWVDTDLWMVRRAEYWDINGNRLKTVKSENLIEVDGIWQVQRMHAVNHKSGHQTVMEFSRIDVKTPIDDGKFTERALKRGVRGR